jgi:hypothetical protein
LGYVAWCRRAKREELLMHPNSIRLAVVFSIVGLMLVVPILAVTL